MLRILIAEIYQLGSRRVEIQNNGLEFAINSFIVLALGSYPELLKRSLRR